jgi:endogenous inhibitor of DNA gyrase (YacG/DUF329 family)
MTRDACAVDAHMGDMQDHTASRPVPRCPICRKPAVVEFRPFCSKRCADVDLNRWLSGAYIVPGREEEDEDGLGADRTSEEER